MASFVLLLQVLKEKYMVIIVLDEIRVEFVIRGRFRRGECRSKVLPAFLFIFFFVFK